MVRCGWAASSKAERRTPSWLTATPAAASAVGEAVAAFIIARAAPSRAVCGAVEGGARRADAAERDALVGQPLVGVVGAQRQAIFGARGEHAIGLADALGDEIVDHHAEIGFGAVEDAPAPPAGQRAALSPATRPCAAASS